MPYMREAKRLEFEEYIGGTQGRVGPNGGLRNRYKCEEIVCVRVIIHDMATTSTNFSFLARLIRMYTACLSEAAASEDCRHFTDHRFFYAEDNIGKASCGLVKDLTKNFPWAQHTWSHSEFIEPRWEGATQAHSSIKEKSLHDNFVLEFMLKNTVLGWFHNQGNRALRIEKCNPTFFTGTSPTFTNETSIYIPQGWHPLVDAVYVRINKTGTGIIQGIRSVLKSPEVFGETETPFVQLTNE